jgi:hypothetical protein
VGGGLIASALSREEVGLPDVQGGVVRLLPQEQTDVEGSCKVVAGVLGFASEAEVGVGLEVVEPGGGSPGSSINSPAALRRRMSTVLASRGSMEACSRPLELMDSRAAPGMAAGGLGRGRPVVLFQARIWWD